jgi:transposase InsO family protein
MPEPLHTVNDRLQFIAAHQSGMYTMTELAARYRISRQAGYDWVNRYNAEGADGLKPASHAPHHCPHRISEGVAELLLEARRKHPTWGARKLIPWLIGKRPELEGKLPAASTVADLFERRGMVEPRRRRRRVEHQAAAALRASEPNQSWSADYKGQFRTRDGIECYPLTVTDAFSRALLLCDALLSVRFAEAKPSWERCFTKYGLPERMRTDNGPPFAAPTPLGLTRLNVWWTQLGIVHDRIEPGRPDQNGSHERMHKTLKAETTKPPGQDQADQQAMFCRFVEEFVFERPHESLGQRTPGSLYTRSERAMPEQLPKPEYEGHWEPRRVRPPGTFKFKGREIFLSSVLAGEHIALDEVDDGVWSIYFYRLLLGRLDERTGMISG